MGHQYVVCRGLTLVKHLGALLWRSYFVVCDRQRPLFQIMLQRGIDKGFVSGVEAHGNEGVDGMGV